MPSYFSKTLPQIAAADIGAAHREALLRELQAAGDARRGRLPPSARLRREHLLRGQRRGRHHARSRSPYRADRFAFGESRIRLGAAQQPAPQRHAPRRCSPPPGRWWSARSARDRDARRTDRRESRVARRRGRRRHRARGVRAAQPGRAAHRRADGRRLPAHRRAAGGLRAQRRVVRGAPDYRLDVTVTPPPLRASIEGAAYYPAPPFKTSGVGRFYVTPTGDDVAQLRQEHNYAAMPDLAGHEGFPGHDWHYKVMTQYREQISPVRWLTPGAVEDSSSMWQDSMAAEGWALYAEALLAEPAAGRAARLLLSGGAPVPAARQALPRPAGAHRHRPAHRASGFRGRGDAVLAGCGFPARLLPGPGGARSPRPSRRAARRRARAVTRYARWPTQAITYRLGKEQILELRQRAQRAARRALLRHSASTSNS